MNTVNTSRRRKARLAVLANSATRSAMVGHIGNELVQHLGEQVERAEAAEKQRPAKQDKQ